MSLSDPRVVNVKVKYIRPQYQNLKEWCEDPKNVYIGRRGIVFIDGKRYPKFHSPFANTFKTGRDGTREEVVEKYKVYILQRLEDGKISREDLRGLLGKNLGCWCKPARMCRGDILLEILRDMFEEKEHLPRESEN